MARWRCSSPAPRARSATNRRRPARARRRGAGAGPARGHGDRDRQPDRRLRPGPLLQPHARERPLPPPGREEAPRASPAAWASSSSNGVTRGHLAAAERGRDGERYILTDAYVTLNQLAEEVVRIAGRGRVPPTIPVSLAKVFAAGEAISSLLKRPPMLARGQLHFFQWQARADSTKAERELGFRKTPLEDGLGRTLEAMDLRARD